jgi:uncharacterized protein (UPF0218 family)
MAVAYILTPELRVRLKKPLGTLIRGTYSETMKILREMMEREKPTIVISVGDTVSKNLAENRIFTQLTIVDNKVMRKNIEPISLSAEKTFHAKNPQGTITMEAMTTIQESLRSNCRTRIIVDGEEDLLTLVAVLYSPENSFIVYGQPHEGIVVVKATSEKKAEVAGILSVMENVRKAK